MILSMLKAKFIKLFLSSMQPFDIYLDTKDIRMKKINLAHVVH